MKRNNLERFRKTKSQRQAFGEEIHKKQIGITAQGIITLAEKHGVSLIEFLEDRSIPEEYKKIVERKIREHKGTLNL